MSHRPILIVDGLNLFMRHYIANPSMSEMGHHVGGFIGFLKGVQLLCDRTSPSKIIVVWESGGSPRRRAIYKDYKQKRRPQKLNRFYLDDIPDTVQNRDNQITKIIEALRYVPVKQLYIPDCEADDIIAHMAKNTFRDSRCVIVSSDRDLYQLLSKNVIQWSPGQKRYITPKTLIEKFGIASVNFCTARSFIGDKSDGIPGVPRAGFASLAKRFPMLGTSKFVSVQDLVDQADQLKEDKKLKLYESMCMHASVAHRNWKLMFLDTQNLSAEHIKKFDYSIENSAPLGDKMSLIKMFLREGISNFNIDAFYASINACRRNEN